MKQLSGLDAMFLYWETQGAAMHVAMVSVYAPSAVPGQVADFDRVREHIRQCLPLSDVFRQKLAPVPFSLDHPYWVQDADFDLDNHIHQVRLAEPSWDAFCTLLSELHERPLDLGRPLWEMHFIEGLGGVREDFPPGSFAILTKIHHAAIDGSTGAELTAGLHDLTPDAQRTALSDPWLAERAPTRMELLARAAYNNVHAQRKLVGTVRRMLPGIVSTLRSSRRQRGPMTRFNGRVSATRVYEAREYPVKDLSAIRKAVPGATVNDVILAICSGAIRQYLQAKRELPAESLTVMAPINVRQPGEKTARGGNEVSLMTLPLCTDVAQPLKRLAAIHHHTSNAKEMIKAIGARELTDANKSAPAATMALSFRLVTGANLLGKLRAFNTVVSNVPGPQVPVYLCGARLLYWSGLGPASNGVGVAFPILSYNGNVNFGISGCREMLPDPSFLAECLDQSFEKLATAAAKPATRRAAKEPVS